MKNPEPQNRVRCTSATRRRSDNLIRLVERLKLGEMKREDMQDMFNFSPSGMRKYIKDLKAAGVLLVVRHDERESRHVMDQSQGVEIYGLTDDTERVAKLLELLNVGKLMQKDERVGKYKKQEPDEPRRTFTNRWKVAPVVHEPVLAAFFGLVKA